MAKVEHLASANLGNILNALNILPEASREISTASQKLISDKESHKTELDLDHPAVSAAILLNGSQYQLFINFYWENQNNLPEKQARVQGFYINISKDRALELINIFKST